MQMYVNYYDRYEKIEGENPTIGILLCKQSDEALVDLTLPENANIYAKEYKLYLPDKKLLQKKLKEWLDEEQNWFRGRVLSGGSILVNNNNYVCDLTISGLFLHRCDCIPN